MGSGRYGDWGGLTSVVRGISPVPANYDGDGIAQVSNSHRTEAASLWVATGGGRFYFGDPWEDPVPADYDGDGNLDAAVFGEDSGVWKVRNLPPVYFRADGDFRLPAV
jgi:hypothetical protein